MASALPTDVQSAVTEAVKSGRYASEDDVLREAIALLLQRDEESRVRANEFVAMVEQGVREADAGLCEFVSREEMKRYCAEQYRNHDE